MRLHSTRTSWPPSCGALVLETAELGVRRVRRPGPDARPAARWLANLGRLRSFEHDVAAGRVTAEADLLADAPTEIQEAIRAVNRSAASLRDQYGQRIDSLMNSLMQHKSAVDQAAIVCEVDRTAHHRRQRPVRAQQRLPARRRRPRLADVGRPAGARLPWQPSPRLERRGRGRGPSGRRQWYRTIVPIFDANGGVERYICIDIDITERKEFERAIVENAHAPDPDRANSDARRWPRTPRRAVRDAARAAATASACATARRCSKRRRDGMLVRAGAGRLAQSPAWSCPARRRCWPTRAPTPPAALVRAAGGACTAGSRHRRRRRLRRAPFGALGVYAEPSARFGRRGRLS
jgi:PAS domain-containing protein